MGVGTHTDTLEGDDGVGSESSGGTGSPESHVSLGVMEDLEDTQKTGVRSRSSSGSKTSSHPKPHQKQVCPLPSPDPVLTGPDPVQSL